MRQNRRRNLHELHAAHIRSGHEARQVPNDSAAKGDDGRFTVQSRLKRLLNEKIQHLQRLGRFTRRDNRASDRIAACAQALFDRSRIQAFNGAIGNEQYRRFDGEAALGEFLPNCAISPVPI